VRVFCVLFVRVIPCCHALSSTHLRRANFGPDIPANALSAQYGSYQATGCVFAAAHTTIVCTTVAGVGANFVWILTVASRTVSNPALKTSYIAPSISDITGITALSTAGNQAFTLTGANFGPSGTLAEVVYSSGGRNKYNVSCTVTTPHSQITCLSAAGVGTGFSLTLTIGGQPVVVTPSPLRYVAPTVSDVTMASPISTLGGTMFTIIGANLGPKDALICPIVTYTSTSGGAPYTATNCTGSASPPHTQLICTSAVGVGKNFVFRVTVGGQTAPDLGTVHRYAAPSISTITATRLAALGGTLVTFTGASFGPAGTPITATMGPLGTEHALAAGACWVQSDGSARCIAPAGVGTNHRWTLYVAQQQGTSPVSVTTSYAVPTLDTLTSSLMTTDGTTLIKFTGRDFGPLSLDSSWSNLGVSISVSYGTYTATGCVVTGLGNPQMMECSSAVGMGGPFPLVVVIGGQTATGQSLVVDYFQPTISTILPTSYVTNGGTVVTLTG